MALADVLREWALYFAAMDWHVFPLVAHDKRPALHGVRACPGTGPCVDGHQGWEQRATADPERIRAAWSHASYNIGIATGPSGLVVLDLDTAEHSDDSEGEAALAELAAARGVQVPDTYTVSTPSGGKHLYFTTPDGVELRNTSGHLATTIDTRAGGGYVVAAGSVLADRGYELLDDRDPVELPGWTLQALCERPAQAESAPHRMPVQRPDAYGTAALAGECDRVRTARTARNRTTTVLGGTPSPSHRHGTPTHLQGHTVTIREP